MLSENTRKSICIVGFHLPRTLENANRSTVAEIVSVVTGDGKAGEGGRGGSQSVRRKLLWVVDMFTRLIVSMVS